MLDQDGFVRVDACLRAEGRDDVFAAGDIAAFGPRGLPKSGVYAVRAGPVLADNIRNPSQADRCAPSARSATRCISSRPASGMPSARATASWSRAHWVWRWKDFIDRRFMAEIQRTPRHGPSPRAARPRRSPIRPS